MNDFKTWVTFQHGKICFLRYSKSHFSPLFLLTKMQNFMKKRSWKSRMGNVRVDTSAQWQKQKNKQLFRSCLLSRWLSLGKTKICLFFQFFVTNAFLNYQFISYGFLVYQHYRWLLVKAAVKVMMREMFRLPPEERLLEGSHNPMCEVFPKGNFYQGRRCWWWWCLLQWLCVTTRGMAGGEVRRPREPSVFSPSTW